MWHWVRFSACRVLAFIINDGHSRCTWVQRMYIIIDIREVHYDGYAEYTLLRGHGMYVLSDIRYVQVAWGWGVVCVVWTFGLSLLTTPVRGGVSDNRKFAFALLDIRAGHPKCTRIVHYLGYSKRELCLFDSISSFRLWLALS